MTGYQQLSRDERLRIETLLLAGFSQAQVAQQLGRPRSTICRELQRNSSFHRYEAGRAQERALSRARGRPPCCIRAESLSEPRGSELWRWVIAGLEQGWSPEQIAGRWRLLRPSSRLCAETIYRFIYRPSQQDRQWWLYLPLKRRKRGRPRRPGNRLSACDWGQRLSARPLAANTRSEAGHWEIDTVCFSHSSGVIVHLVERLSRFGVALLMASRAAEPIAEAVARRLARLPAALCLSLSADRGSEFSLLQSKGLNLYLCDPYSAWQKGTVENHNGLLRRYFPRSTDMTGLSQAELNDIRQEINRRPMKVLGFHTPHEVLSSLARQAVALHP